jgi:hypothetical protein
VNLADVLLPFAVGCGGIVLGSILNYFILKRLFRGQVMGVIGLFEETKTGKEVAEMIHKLSDWSKGDTAEGLLEKVVQVIDRVNRFADSEDAKEIASKVIRALDDLIGDDGTGEIA